MSRVNELGLTRESYVGAKSTLCTGCGHDSITNHIVSAFFQNNVSPYKVAKVSGIGCSSKTPAYFLSQSHGFNSIHGRMAPVATGAGMANADLNLIGVSGDGDSASIGLGGFVHLLRRNLSMIYLVENNGVYGLTKGQFSATADVDSTQKSGEKNPFSTIDLCSLAIEMGCGFVARSFSGDSKQMISLLSAAMRHNGTVLIDVVSPCVTFANHEGSTKSYNYLKEHRWDLQEMGFVSAKNEIVVEYKDGEKVDVEMHDGSHLTLLKLEKDFDHTNAAKAMQKLRESRDKGMILTGLLHLNESKKSLSEQINLCDKPLSSLTEAELRPSKEILETILSSYS